MVSIASAHSLSVARVTIGKEGQGERSSPEKEGVYGANSVSPEPIRLGFPDLGEEELAEIAAVLDSGQLTMGPKVGEFEAELARACGVAEAVAVSSGTAALHLAVLALGIGPGDEVIVPAYTFPATANVVVLAGAKAVLVDVDPRTMSVVPDRVYEAVTPRTKAVIAVHLFGRPLDWEALQSAVPPEVALLEDAAGALGALWRGMPCGGLGLLGCLSFHPRKIVTTGEGGAVTTSDPEIADTIRRLRHHGIEPRGQFEIAAPGTNYRLSDVLCALGLPQLRRLQELLGRREALAAAYVDRLEDVVETPSADEGDRHGWQAFVVGVDRRDQVVATLRAGGIEAQVGTYALHRLRAYADQGPFPGADGAFERALALPFHTKLTEVEIDRVATALTAAVSE